MIPTTLPTTPSGGLAFGPRGSVGALAAGSLADLVVVDGDPLADVRVLQDRAKLRETKDGRMLLMRVLRTKYG